MNRTIAERLTGLRLTGFNHAYTSCIGEPVVASLKSPSTQLRRLHDTDICMRPSDFMTL